MRWWINPVLPMLPPQLSINAFDYNCHVDLIKLLRQEGELLRLRKARQKMSELFPLTEGWCAAPRDQARLSQYSFCVFLTLNFTSLNNNVSRIIDNFRVIRVVIFICMFLLQRSGWTG